MAANAEWNQLVDRYLGEPCDLEVFTFGNMWQDLTRWEGSPDSLLGTQNPNVEGGAITNLADYAKLLQVHLNGGYCGATRVLSEEAVATMQVDLGGVVESGPVPYGMGWWISTEHPGVFDDPGAFGAISFIDAGRGIGAYVAIDDYTSSTPVRRLTWYGTRSSSASRAWSMASRNPARTSSMNDPGLRYLAIPIGHRLWLPVCFRTRASGSAGGTSSSAGAARLTAWWQAR